MAHFYFDLYECGKITPDEEGQELADVQGARRVAIQTARDIMAHEVLAGRLCMACRIEVSDHQHQHLLSVPFRDAISLSGL